MTSSIAKLSIAAALVGATACQFIARGPEQYQADTQVLLETKNAEIKQCYDQALKQDATMQGTVGVRFTVMSETGQISDAAVDPALTNAPEPLGQCVVNALNGLQLDPPDERDGQATYLYQFTVNPPQPAAAPAAPEAEPAG